MCDVIMKFLGEFIHPSQITFLRFFFAAIWLLPFFLNRRHTSLHMGRVGIYGARGIMLSSAMALWCLGLKHVSLPTASVIGFSIPFFLLILAKIFLGEHIGRGQSIATAIGFIGIASVIDLPSIDISLSTIPLLASAILFAAMDVLNKRFAAEEPMIPMLFYSAVATAIFSAVPAYFLWRPLQGYQWFLMIALGACANLLLFCIIRSMRLLEASATAPYRYVEFIFSNFSGYFLFHELPSMGTFVGVAIIIPTTLYIVWNGVAKYGCHE
jgi:S-adenosylmethionine uptake transporter